MSGLTTILSYARSLMTTTYTRNIPTLLQPEVTLSDKELAGHRIDELDDQQMYQIGVSHKDLFSPAAASYPLINALNLSHISIGVEVDSGQWALYGRQSPFLRREDSEYFSRTLMDNEKNYSLPIGTDFHVQPLPVKVSGADLKQAVQATDKDICQAQTCTMVSSNCTTAAVNVLTELKKTLNSRAETYDSEAAVIDQGIQYIWDKDYGIGLWNNPVIARSLWAMPEPKPLIQHSEDKEKRYQAKAL